MNAQELSALIKQAQTGDTEGYAQLYRAVYRPVYKIARMAMKSEDAAVEAVRLTVLDSFAALPAARLTSSPQFIEWLVHTLHKIQRAAAPQRRKGAGDDIIILVQIQAFRQHVLIALQAVKKG